jgi:hypothetical protein
MANILPQVDALNLSPRFNNQGADVNPCTRASIKLYAENYVLGPLNNDELNIFKAQFSTLITGPTSDERKIMLDRIEAYILGLRAVKQALNNVAFTGLNAEDTEIGMGIIRPQFTVAGAVAVPLAYRANWNQALTPAWADWFWNGAGLPMQAGQDFGFVVTHLKSLLAPVPFMSEYRFAIGRTTNLIPGDVRTFQQADNENGVAIAAIPTMIVTPKSSFYARARSDINGTDQVALGGLVFGLGRALTQEVPTWTP